MIESDSVQQFYISTAEAPTDDRPRVLKHGDLFALFNRYGDIEAKGMGEEGLFYEGTRFLSRFSLRLGTSSPLLLSSSITADNFLFTADLTNVDVMDGADVHIPRGTLHIHRSKFLWNGACYEKIRIANYGLSGLTIALEVNFDADFADIFEVRGVRREHRGIRLEDETGPDWARLSYRGLDDVVRRTWIQCLPAPRRVSPDRFSLTARLEPKQEKTFHIVISCVDPLDDHITWDEAFEAGKKSLSAEPLSRWQIQSSNDYFNRWLRRSVADVRTMIHGNLETGYPYAGIPWFSTVFGRDGIITALECLWLAPSIAKNVLTYLASTQATAEDPTCDAEPGKIVHEMRRGEMAALGEVPFGLYYGSVDATPLFVMLAGAYFERTGDRSFIEFLWPYVEAALRWINDYGDRDGDGFVEYSRRSAHGLVQQGWKDSHDSVFHADGALAEPPIALCEVQGYVYAAKRAAAILAAVLGKWEQSQELDAQAARLQVEFDRQFWCADLNTYALALDGEKRPCRVRTSNAGHCLFAGIAFPDKAQLVAESLLGDDLFSGWGVRTLSSREVRYNPISYHNGSVWPHDNALLASGFSRYGQKEQALRVLTGLLDASAFVDLHRLPELFCGLHRREGQGPTLYPVACSPQAWSAASVFLILQACLGVSVDAVAGHIKFFRPRLPENIAEVRIRGLELGSTSVDLFVKQGDGGAHVRLLDSDVEVRVTVES